MKTYWKITLLLVLSLCFCACTQTFYETAERDKVATIERNLIVLSSSTPAEVLVSYYDVNDAISNKLVTKTVHTPYLLEMGKAVVHYDSVDFKWRGGYCGKKHLIDGHKEFDVKKLLGAGGAEYLKLENLSDQSVKLAIVGVQKIVTTRDEERIVIESQPSPIYKGVPLLYLLKPELAPNREFYFRTVNYDGDSSDEGLEKILLYSEQLGDFSSAALPFSADKIVSLYENDSQHLYVNYFNYSFELRGERGANREFRALRERGLELFSVLQPRAVVYNNGTFPLLPLKFEGQLQRTGDRFLVKENW